MKAWVGGGQLGEVNGAEGRKEGRKGTYVILKTNKQKEF